jgi:aminopeptidase
MDPRITAYAKLLVERSLDVQPGWQVWINSSWLARPLVQEVVRAIAARGAYPLVRLGDASMEDVPFEVVWALEAPEELLSEVAPADRHAWETMDAWMNIGAPENTSAGSELSPEREALLAKARHPMRTRRLSDEIPWVACRFPTPALAQDSRMSLREFEDFLYGACLRDWDAEAARMSKIKERFDRASEVRIIGAGTDLTVSLEGREGEVDAGHSNMPGGEVYFSPVEDATDGVVHFSEFPAFNEPHEIEGARMVYKGGRVVEASATRGEDVLLEKLDQDEGARVLGELGIGCNRGI